MTWEAKRLKTKTAHVETLKLGPLTAPVTIVPDGDMINLIAQGVAAGYKVARGVGAVTGSLVVASGLASIVAVVATLKDDAALTGTLASATWTGANITLKVWKPTAANDCTPIASTTATNVNWVAIGS